MSLKNNLKTNMIAVASKGILPVLSHFNLKQQNGKLTVSTTDLEVFAETVTENENDSDFNICVPAKEFNDIVSKLDDFKLSVDLGILTIKAGRKKIKLNTLPSDDFPKIPSGEEKVVFESENKVDFLESVLKCNSFATDAAKTILTGISIRNGKLASTDGYRLSVLGLETSGDIDIIAPAEALTKAVKSLMKAGDESIKVSTVSGSFLKLTSGEVSVFTRLIEGKYPDYNKILPKSFKTKMTFNRKEVLSVLNEAKILSSQQTRVVSFSVADKELSISTQNEKGGFSDVITDVHVDGEGIIISFNLEYLQNALSKFGSESLTMNINSEVQPVVLESEGSDDHKVMVMPIKP